MHALYLPRCCQYDNGWPDTFNDTLRSPLSADGTAPPGVANRVPARQARAVRLKAGQVIRIVNTHGTQVCDMWAFNADDLSEYFSIEHTRGGLGRVNPRVGDTLLSNRRRAILRFAVDNSPGVHDTLIAACDVGRYRGLGVKGYHDNCADNLRQALIALGLRVAGVPQPLNLWMNIPLATDASLTFEPTVARPGDAVEFHAAMDCLVVLSACPMDLNPINGMRPSDIHFVVRGRHEQS